MVLLAGLLAAAACHGQGDRQAGTGTAGAGGIAGAGAGGAAAGGAGAGGAGAGGAGAGGAGASGAGACGAGAGGAGTGGAGGGPAAGPRGLYVSLHADHVGVFALSGAAEILRNVLGDVAKEAHLLDFARTHEITTLTLYDLGSILDDRALSEALIAFAARARAAGILRLEAIGAADAAAWDRIAAFQRTHGTFDGLVTEIEFWNGDVTFAELTRLLDDLRALGLADARGAPLPLAVYVGRFDAAQALELARRVDRVYVHCYTRSGESTFDYGRERFQLLAAASTMTGRALDVLPIFSAEGVDFRAGGETFMGEWLSAHGLDEAERWFLGGWSAAALPASLRLAGTQYYEYVFLERYLGAP